MSFGSNHQAFEKPRIGIVDILHEYGLVNGFGVEVGVKCGDFSTQLLKSWNCQKLFLVDMWEGYDEYDEMHDHMSNYEKCVNNMASFPSNKYQILKMASVDASTHFPDNSLDFVYLDANHSYDGVKNDLHAWYPKIKKGGILAGDDYHLGSTVRLNIPQIGNDVEFGVTKAVREFAVNKQKNLSIDIYADWCMAVNGQNVPMRNWWFVV